MGRKNLSEIVAGYPDDHPQTLAALLDAEPSHISAPIAWDLRKQALGLAGSWEQHYITGPWDVLELIVSGYVIHPWDSAWKSYALSSERQPILMPADNGRARYLSKATRLLPKPEQLTPLYEKTSIRRAPAWLVIYGGTPDILAKDGVVPGLIRLARKASVADFVFFNREEDEEPTLWSIRAGTGMAGISRASAREVPFPDPEAVTEIRSTL